MVTATLALGAQPGGPMATNIWWCKNCGYETDSPGQCADCGEPLSRAPLTELEPGAADEEVAFGIYQWDATSSARLIDELVEQRVPHRFEGQELVVRSVDEARSSVAEPWRRLGPGRDSADMCLRGRRPCQVFQVTGAQHRRRPCRRAGRATGAMTPSAAESPVPGPGQRRSLRQYRLLRLVRRGDGELGPARDRSAVEGTDELR